MTKRMLPLFAGAFALVSLAGAGHAQDGSNLTAAQAAETRAKLEIATGVITLGRSNKDPMMLVVGAKILSEIGTVSGEGEASSAYDIAAVLDEAKGMAGDNQYLLDAIAAVPADRPIVA
ncbi:MAG: hypothetical protein JJ913_08495 [Rhizobiaceae bacterium]|nr:hypothetical protein [Rhizobiaceae bacterium]